MTDDPIAGAQSQISLTRTIDAAVEDVFMAWTDPALIEQWQADRAETDPQPGGRFRYVTENAEEDGPGELVVSGEYLEYVEDRRLVLSWVVENGGEDGGQAIFVLEIDFRPLEGRRTQLTLVERGAAHADAQSRIFSIEAWSAAIEHLAELIE